MEIAVTTHGEKMLRKRVGSRNAEEVFSDALFNGIHHHECKGKLKKYLDGKGKIHKSHSVIYRGVVFFYDIRQDGTRVLITCYQIPSQFTKTVKSLEAKKERNAEG